MPKTQLNAAITDINRYLSHNTITFFKKGSFESLTQLANTVKKTTCLLGLLPDKLADDFKTGHLNCYKFITLLLPMVIFKRTIVPKENFPAGVFIKACSKRGMSPRVMAGSHTSLPLSFSL